MITTASNTLQLPANFTVDSNDSPEAAGMKQAMADALTALGNPATDPGQRQFAIGIISGTATDTEWSERTGGAVVYDTVNTLNVISNQENLPLVTRLAAVKLMAEIAEQDRFTCGDIIDHTLNEMFPVLHGDEEETLEDFLQPGWKPGYRLPEGIEEVHFAKLDVMLNFMSDPRTAEVIRGRTLERNSFFIVTDDFEFTDRQVAAWQCWQENTADRKGAANLQKKIAIMQTHYDDRLEKRMGKEDEVLCMNAADMYALMLENGDLSSPAGKSMMLNRQFYQYRHGMAA